MPLDLNVPIFNKKPHNTQVLILIFLEEEVKREIAGKEKQREEGVESTDCQTDILVQ